ncbi:MAG: hypothetical protein ACKVIN_07660 [Longimicrobiales bacterium]
MTSRTASFLAQRVVHLVVATVRHIFVSVFRRRNGKRGEARHDLLRPYPVLSSDVVGVAAAMISVGSACDELSDYAVRELLASSLRLGWGHAPLSSP